MLLCHFYFEGSKREALCLFFFIFPSSWMCKHNFCQRSHYPCWYTILSMHKIVQNLLEILNNCIKHRSNCLDPLDFSCCNNVLGMLLSASFGLHLQPSVICKRPHTVWSVIDVLSCGGGGGGGLMATEWPHTPWPPEATFTHIKRDAGPACDWNWNEEIQGLVTRLQGRNAAWMQSHRRAGSDISGMLQPEVIL